METTANTQKLSSFMKVSIAILSAVTLASISLLFIGDFEGKFERVFSTLALFAVFVLLTAFDTRRERKNEWYAPVALIANAYILGLLLIVIWITPYQPIVLLTVIVWKSLFVIVTTRLVTFGLELLMAIGKGKPTVLGTWGQITSILAVITLILFTAPTGIEAFRLTIPSLYWKVSVAALILTALGLAITFLLNWYYASEQKQINNHVYSHQGYPVQPAVVEHQPLVQPYHEAPQTTLVQAEESLLENQAQPEQQTQTLEPELLPWPTFADGTPFPQLPNGQPDFSVLNQRSEEI